MRHRCAARWQKVKKKLLLLPTKPSRTLKKKWVSSAGNRGKPALASLLGLPLYYTDLSSFMPTASHTTRTPLMLLGIVVLVALLALLSLTRLNNRLGTRYTR